MLSQPKESYISNDDIQTPDDYCRALVRYFGQYFMPGCLVLEPCRGAGNFYRAICEYLESTDFLDYQVQYREIKEGLDFLLPDSATGPWIDWIISNPPWSKVGTWRESMFLIEGEWTDWFASNDRRTIKLKRLAGNKIIHRKRIGFLERSFQLADNVVFLCTLNHMVGLKARYDLMEKYGFGVRTEILLPTPVKPWPQMGFQLAAVYFQRGYTSEFVQRVNWRKGLPQI